MNMLQVAVLGVAGVLLAVQFKGGKNRIQYIYCAGSECADFHSSTWTVGSIGGYCA